MVPQNNFLIRKKKYIRMNYYILVNLKSCCYKVIKLNLLLFFIEYKFLVIKCKIFKDN